MTPQQQYEEKYGKNSKSALEMMFVVRSIDWGFQMKLDENDEYTWQWYYKTGSLVETKKDAYSLKIGSEKNVQKVIGIILDRQHELEI